MLGWEGGRASLKEDMALSMVSVATGHLCPAWRKSGSNRSGRSQTSGQEGTAGKIFPRKTVYRMTLFMRTVLRGTVFGGTYFR